MYYLRSRYLSPIRDRYLNSDSDHALFYDADINYFAYCANNPTVYIDPTGKVRLYGLEIPYYAYFHNKVLRRVADINNLQKEFRLKDGRFRIDLLGEKGEVYEVKPLPLHHLEAAFKRYYRQVDNYVTDPPYHRGNAADLTMPEIEPFVIGGYEVRVELTTKDELILYKVIVDGPMLVVPPVSKQDTQGDHTTAQTHAPSANASSGLIKGVAWGLLVGMGLSIAGGWHNPAKMYDR